MHPKAFLEIKVRKAIASLAEKVKATEVDDVASMKKYVTTNFTQYRKWLKDDNAFKLKEKELHLELDKKLKIFEELKKND
jgi:hypothetical protein